MLRKNELYDVNITDTNDLGYGVCRIGDVVTFVANAVWGDEATVRIIKVAKSYAVARVEALTRPSPRRTQASCEVFPRCGGCSFLNLSDESEKELKENFVKSAVRKAALDLPVRELIAGEKRTAYRNKAQYPLFCDSNGRVRAGFFARHSHTPMAAEDCLLQPAFFSEIAHAFCRAFTEAGLSCYDETAHRGLLRHLILRADTQENIVAEIVIHATQANKLAPLIPALAAEFPRLKGICANFNTQNTNVIRGARSEVLFGDTTLTQSLCGKTFSHGPASFFQVNTEGAELLFREGRRLLNAAASDSVCDLYCGVGAVGQCVAPESRLYGADVVSEAVLFAAKNAEKNGCDASYLAMDAAEYFDASGAFDAVLVDPPRSGLSERMSGLLLQKKPKKILYISCNPTTLCRDLACLTQNTYETDGITPVELFPQTGHVECVCLLKRK